MVNFLHRATQRALGLVAFVLLLPTGCAPAPIALTPQQLEAKYKTFRSNYEADLQKMDRRMFARIRSEHDRGETIDILMLSGGGALGAFGAGFLQGWQTLEGNEHELPKFDSVSGVSTGALIAPFAFVGTDEAYATIVDLYNNPTEDWATRRSLWRVLTRGQSLTDPTELRNTIREAVSPELVRGVADGYTEGRQLLVGATNLNFGVMRVWDVGEAAATADKGRAEQHIADVLIGSSALPAVFPPHEIDGDHYVDGGAVAQMVTGIEDRRWLFGGEQSIPGLTNAETPIKLRVWMIVNNKLLPDAQSYNPKFTRIAARSISTIVRTSTLQSIQDMATYIGAINAHPQFEAEFRYVAIPADVQLPQATDLFNLDAMRGLIDLGRTMGADPQSWLTRPLRVVAPFLAEPEAG